MEEDVSEGGTRELKDQRNIYRKEDGLIGFWDKEECSRTYGLRVQLQMSVKRAYHT